jgi:membrane protease subunit HflK
MSTPNIRRIPRPPDDPPEINTVVVGIVAAIVALGVLAYACVYRVEAQERGVVLTLGRYTKTTAAGLHFKLPPPLQTVTKVAVTLQRTQEFGVGVGRSANDESEMLTGDLNVVSVKWITQYKVDDPYAFLFKVRNPEETFRDMNQAVMRAVVGDRSVSEVLTVGREEIQTEVQRRLQELCEQYESGLLVERVVLQDVTPPDAVKASFNEVNAAQQEKERKINEAETERNRVIPRANGEREQMIQAAEGEASRRVNRATGDVARFRSLLAEYKLSPDVTRQRIYLETMQEILPNANRTVVLGKDLKGLLPLLSLESQVKP